MNAEFTREELVALFGEEAGAIMFAQQEESKGSGGSLRTPFPLLKKVTDGDLGLGKFGSFVFGVELAKEKEKDGSRAILNVGTNVGEEFELVIVAVGYRFKRWVESTGKTEWSNIFTDMEGFKNAVTYSGQTIPGDKEKRTEQGWKTVKIMGCLVKAGKSWEPVVLEIDGKLYFTFNDLIDKAPGKGVLSTIVKVKTATEKKGTTKYTVIDVENSSFTTGTTHLPIITENREKIADISVKMKAYFDANDYKKGAAPVAQNTQPATVSDDTNW